MAGGLPGWGGADVGHAVAVHGYARDGDGTEYVLCAGMAQPLPGYSGDILRAQELHGFWQAVSGNSGQVC